MKLVLSDKEFDFIKSEKDINYFNLSAMKISNCVGCFGCWTKTPGKCVIRDEAVKIYPLIAQSEKVLYISHIVYGSYDVALKTMFERAIPIQQAFIRILDNETHHVQRNVIEKDATIIGYGNISDEEKEIFKELVSRNAKNMNFKKYNVIFATIENVDEIVKKEFEKWEKWLF